MRLVLLRTRSQSASVFSAVDADKNPVHWSNNWHSGEIEATIIASIHENEFTTVPGNCSVPNAAIGNDHATTPCSGTHALYAALVSFVSFSSRTKRLARTSASGHS